MKRVWKKGDEKKGVRKISPTTEESSVGLGYPYRCYMCNTVMDNTEEICPNPKCKVKQYNVEEYPDKEE